MQPPSGVIVSPSGTFSSEVRRRHAVLGAAGVFGLTAAMAAAGCSRPQTAAEPPPVPVVVAQVVRKDVPFEVTSIGTVVASKTVEIRSLVGGELLRVSFEEGQTVRKGDALLLIDPAPYRATLESARADLARDTATLQNDQATLARYRDLIQKDYVTKQQYDDLVANLESMRATVRADSAAIDKARLDLEHCSITTPINGKIGLLLVDEGNIVKANSDNPLVVIRQIRPIQVTFTVPQKHLTEILQHAARASLEVLVNSPEEPRGAHRGALTFIDNTVDASTGTILLRADFANEDEMLWPGEFVNVVLVLKQLQGAVVVPTHAIGTSQDGDYVFVVKADRTAELRPVRVSYRFNEDTVVESGVEPGETIVTDGQLRLRPGSKVVEKQPVAVRDSTS
jgi:multidrug efflux system membrane fusion protein